MQLRRARHGLDGLRAGRLERGPGVGPQRSQLGLHVRERRARRDELRRQLRQRHLLEIELRAAALGLAAGLHELGAQPLHVAERRLERRGQLVAVRGRPAVRAALGCELGAEAPRVLAGRGRLLAQARALRLRAGQPLREGGDLGGRRLQRRPGGAELLADRRELGLAVAQRGARGVQGGEGGPLTGLEEREADRVARPRDLGGAHPPRPVAHEVAQLSGVVERARELALALPEPGGRDARLLGVRLAQLRETGLVRGGRRLALGLVGGAQVGQRPLVPGAGLGELGGRGALHGGELRLVGRPQAVDLLLPGRLDGGQLRLRALAQRRDLRRLCRLELSERPGVPGLERLPAGLLGGERLDELQVEGAGGVRGLRLGLGALRDELARVRVAHLGQPLLVRGLDEPQAHHRRLAHGGRLRPARLGDLLARGRSSSASSSRRRPCSASSSSATRASKAAATSRTRSSASSASAARAAARARSASSSASLVGAPQLREALLGDRLGGPHPLRLGGDGLREAGLVEALGLAQLLRGGLARGRDLAAAGRPPGPRRGRAGRAARRSTRRR